MSRRRKPPWYEDEKLLKLRLAGFNLSGQRYGKRAISFATFKEKFPDFVGSRLQCIWCKRLFNDRVKVSFDHYMPLAAGGNHALDNLAFSCRVCNRFKGGTPPEWWGFFIDFLVEQNKLAWFYQQFRPSRWRRKGGF